MQDSHVFLRLYRANKKFLTHFSTLKGQVPSPSPLGICKSTLGTAGGDAKSAAMGSLVEEYEGSFKRHTEKSQSCYRIVLCFTVSSQGIFT